MDRTLTSVGLDVGTTSTQLIVSRLRVEDRSDRFTVPELAIRERQVVYRSPIHFTPLIRDQLVDGEALRTLVESEYTKAGIARKDVDTGAVIITGETSRKENAAAVLQSLTGLAGEFVVATAGPHLESVLAAKGAGAVARSERTGKTVMHFDIGGGTSNWALIADGSIVRTGCLNVGGRLLKFDDRGILRYVSPVVEKLCKLKIGDPYDPASVDDLAELLARGLEMAAGLREPTQLLEKLITRESMNEGIATPVCALARNDHIVYSFSGGVADCIARDFGDLAFGDMGPALGRAIRKSRLCAGDYWLGEETIRATVIGAGCHSTQLSGSTVFHRNVTFPLRDLAVVTDRKALSRLDGPGILALPAMEPTYDRLCALADELAADWRGPMYLDTATDMAKALGHALALRLPKDAPVLCIDGVALKPGDYLDVGEPLGPAIPVVVKTLILEG